MAASIKLGNKFNLQLSRAFHSEVTERINALAAEKSPVRRFIKLVAAVQMCNEKEKLFANGNG